jgi:hypothetical protein
MLKMMDGFLVIKWTIGILFMTHQTKNILDFKVGMIGFPENSRPMPGQSTLILTSSSTARILTAYRVQDNRLKMFKL